MATGATANSTVQYQTIHVGRWVTGCENTFRTVLKVGDTGTANNIRNWGAFTATDGFFFQLNGTNFNVVSRIGSSDTVVPLASFNVSTNFVLDTNYHVYEIRMTFADIHFYIDKQLMHTLKPTTTFFSATLSLPVTLQNNNSGGSTSNVSLAAGVAFIMRTGLLETEAYYGHITGAVTGTVLKRGAGRLHRIIIGNNGATIIIYDNTTNAAPIISTITPDPTTAGTSIELDCPFSTGLTVTTTGAATDITFIYE